MSENNILNSKFNDFKGPFIRLKMRNNITNTLPLPIMVVKQPRVGHDVLHEWLELQGEQDMDCCKDYVAEKREQNCNVKNVSFKCEKDAIA